MPFDEFEVDLPSRGLVLVAGKNGEGKSSLVEAVSVALYGETIRGTSPWPSEKLSGSVTLRLEGGEVAWVTRTGGKSRSLTWSGSPAYPTPAKAAEALAAQIPPYKVWRACSVFRGRDAAIFTGATDGARKELLERILGLERFDEALLRCRADVKTKGAALREVVVRSDRFLDAAERERRSIYEAESSLAAAPGEVSPEDEAEILLLESQRAHAEADRDQIQASRDEAALAAREALTALREAERRRGLLASLSCPECEQEVPERLLAEFEVKAKAAAARAWEAEEAARASRVDADEALLRCRADIVRLDARLAQVRSQVRAARAAGDLRRKLSDQEWAARERLGAAERGAEEARAEKEALSAELAELNATETVLGLRGVRSSVLARALEGLESAANANLSELSPRIRVEVRPYTELKSREGQSDAISVVLHGAGQGHGYRAASDGEGRRVDVALLLALAALSEGALGFRGDLFFDEVFDGLDADGVGALGDLLAELARDRKVVVVSHNPTLLETLRTRARLQVLVADHKIRVREA